MAGPILIVDSSRIHAGKLDELRSAMTRLAEFVEANEPRIIAYHVLLAPGGDRVTVVQIHPDSESAEFHMDVAASAFSGFGDLLTLETMDVYGTPSATLLGRLQRKARMLGNAKVGVHELHAGFARFTSGRGLQSGT